MIVTESTFVLGLLAIVIGASEAGTAGLTAFILFGSSTEAAKPFRSNTNAIAVTVKIITRAIFMPPNIHFLSDRQDYNRFDKTRKG
jgi:hypothetical protein